MVAIRYILVVVLILLTPVASRSRPDAEQVTAARTSLFAQSAVQALSRDFPDANVSFLLLDAHTGQLLASRWERANVPIPLGSLAKPFAALAYGEHHEFHYPAHTCRGSETGCWRPDGHGDVDLPSAIAFSCNSYFRFLTSDLSAADVSPTASRFGLDLPDRGTHGVELAGLGPRWRISPLHMARAYLELLRGRQHPAVQQILVGMERCALHGTGAEVDRALQPEIALVKTGTAACTHPRPAPGDGFVVALVPAEDPRLLLMVRVHGVPGSVVARTAGQMLRRVEEEPGLRSRFPTTKLVLVRFLAPLVLIAAITIQPVSVGGRAGGVAARSDEAVTVSVLGLFHPREFVVSAPAGHALILQAGEQNVVLESSGISSATVRIDGSNLVMSSGRRDLRSTKVTFAGRGNESEDFILEIPSKIKRQYQGTLEIRPASGILVSVVTLDLETAVASVVAAESAPDTPVEAVKAYAIAARSYLVAGHGRHRNFGFCDTTHCQFLRAAPPAGSRAAVAVEATRGLVLAYQSRPFAPMYTRSCSGRTRTPAQLGLPVAAYPYFSVDCEHCRRHPVRWTSYISAQEAGSLRASDETARLATAHHLGWSVVPSNEFSFAKDGDRVLLTGVGNGHGIGLCQAGARAMAESGADFREILEHYYPNTDIVTHLGSNRVE
jgi:stage II sporulation protein D (peptidoglycan lytic transglycosylase)